MKIKLELEAEDALELCKIHAAVMDIAKENIGNDPLHYSSAARVTNNFFDEVVKRLPMDEFKRIKEMSE
jgi:hypothetical protein